MSGKSTIKIIIYVIIFGAFGVSLFFNYKFLKSRGSTPVPEEVQKNAQAQKENFLGKIISFDNDILKIEDLVDQKQTEIKITDKTIIQKSSFGTNEVAEAKKEDIKEGLEANAQASFNQSSQTLEADFVEITLPQEE